MKGPSKGHFTLLATLLAVSLSSAVPVLDKAPTRLHDELYQAAKRSLHPHMTINESPPNEIDGQEWIVDENPAEEQMEDLLTKLSTDELLRMLELLDMLESKAPMQASDREMDTMQYLLKNYQK